MHDPAIHDQQDIEDLASLAAIHARLPNIRLAVVRRSLDMTQDELAAAIGVCRSYISHIERGDKPLKLQAAARIGQGIRTHLAKEHF